MDWEPWCCNMLPQARPVLWQMLWVKSATTRTCWSEKSYSKLPIEFRSWIWSQLQKDTCWTPKVQANARKSDFTRQWNDIYVTKTSFPWSKVKFENPPKASKMIHESMSVCAYLNKKKLKRLILKLAFECKHFISFGSTKLYQSLKVKLWWSDMKRSVAGRVTMCLVCQKVELACQRPARLLLPLRIQAWDFLAPNRNVIP